MNDVGSQQELVRIAQAIAEFQKRRKFADAEMCRKFPDLGHSKTFHACQSGKLDGYDVEAQLARYRAVLAVIESMDNAAEEMEELYDDLSAVLNLKRALLETFRDTGSARVIVVEGDSGTGKSKALELMRERYGSRLLLVEVSDAWADSVMALLGEILRGFGVQELPAGRSERLEATIERLCATRRCVAFDEAHHLGPHTLNTVKTLVNRTPGEFVLLALPTLWRRLERNAYEEARQLTTNRLAERIKLKLTKHDIGKILTRRAPGIEGDLKQVVALIEARAPLFGNLAFVRDVSKRLATMGGDGEKLTIEDAIAAVAGEIESR
jgi:DNA transposition AAA+ family ATPase